MLTLRHVHGLVGTVQNKRTLWRSMFWTLLVTHVVRARSYETINLIGTHCVRTYRVYSWGNELLLSNAILIFQLYGSGFCTTHIKDHCVMHLSQAQVENSKFKMMPQHIKMIKPPAKFTILGASKWGHSGYRTMTPDTFSLCVCVCGMTKYTGQSDLPTSTFSPYFVRKSVTNAGVRFFPKKYVFCNLKKKK